MRFKPHFELQGRHAFLSASKSYWLNYDDHKLTLTHKSDQAARRGSELHEWACMAIKLRRRLPNNKQTINQYVNDAIGFRMTPEVVLWYSDIAFGTADTISFNKNPDTDRMILRIHDLKNGTTKASFRQLELYVVFFCLEYDVNPSDIDIELRIYQNDAVAVHIPDPEVIKDYMARTVHAEALIMQLRLEELDQ